MNPLAPMTTSDCSGIDARHVVSVHNLCKRYGETVVLDEVSFTVEAGELFGLLGTNGAGKTTTVEILQGLHSADSGDALVLGLDPPSRRGPVTPTNRFSIAGRIVAGTDASG